jgi:alpha-tubulin suppressor-like RCC1 family protein
VVFKKLSHVLFVVVLAVALIAGSALVSIVLPKTVDQAIADDVPTLYSSPTGGIEPVSNVQVFSGKVDQEEQLVSLDFQFNTPSYQFLAVAHITASESGKFWINSGGIDSSVGASTYYNAGYSQIPVIFRSSSAHQVVVKSSTPANIVLKIFGQITGADSDTPGPGGTQVVQASTVSDLNMGYGISPEVENVEDITSDGSINGVDGWQTLSVLGQLDIPHRTWLDPQPVRHVYLNVQAVDGDIDFESDVKIMQGQSKLVLAKVDAFGNTKYRKSSPNARLNATVSGFVRETKYGDATNNVSRGQKSGTRLITAEDSEGDRQTDDESDPELLSITIDPIPTLLWDENPQVEISGTVTGSVERVSLYSDAEHLGTAWVDTSQSPSIWHAKLLAGEGSHSITAKAVTATSSSTASTSSTVLKPAQDNLKTPDARVFSSDMASRLTENYDQSMTFSGTYPLVIQNTDASGTPQVDVHGNPLMHEVSVGDVLISGILGDKLPNGVNKRVVAINKMVTKTVLTVTKTDIGDSFVTMNLNQTKTASGNDIKTQMISAVVDSNGQVNYIESANPAVEAKELTTVIENEAREYSKQNPALVEPEDFSSQDDQIPSEFKSMQPQGVDLTFAPQFNACISVGRMPLPNNVSKPDDTPVPAYDDRIVPVSSDTEAIYNSAVYYEPIKELVTVTDSGEVITDSLTNNAQTVAAKNSVTGYLKGCFNVTFGLEVYLKMTIKIKLEWGFIPVGITFDYDVGKREYKEMKLVISGNMSLVKKFAFTPIKLYDPIEEIQAGPVPVVVDFPIGITPKVTFSVGITGTFSLDLGKSSSTSGHSSQRGVYKEAYKSKPKQNSSLSVGLVAAISAQFPLSFQMKFYELIAFVQMAVNFTTTLSVNATYNQTWAECKPKPAAGTLADDAKNALNSGMYSKIDAVNNVQYDGLDYPPNINSPPENDIKPQEDGKTCRSSNVTINFSLELKLDITLDIMFRFLTFTLVDIQIADIVLFDAHLLNLNIVFPITDEYAAPNNQTNNITDSDYAGPGTPLAWGKNNAGQLGYTQNDEVVHSTPNIVAGIPTTEKIASFGNSQFAYTQEGALFAWGDNSLGQLSVGYTGNCSDASTPDNCNENSSPNKVKDAAGAPVGSVKDIIATSDTLYVLKTDGTIWSLSAGHAISQVPLIDHVTVIGAANNTFFAIRADNSLYYIGKNISKPKNSTQTTNEYVIYPTRSQESFVRNKNELTICSITGGNDFALFVVSDPNGIGGQCNLLYGFGSQLNYQLGNGFNIDGTNDPQSRLNLTNIDFGEQPGTIYSVAVSGSSVYVVKVKDSSNNELVVWGDNQQGQLGVLGDDKSLEYKYRPLKVTISDSNENAQPQPVRVSANTGYALILTQDGDVYFTGKNTSGQVMDSSWTLGQNTVPENADEETFYSKKLRLSHVANISAGYQSSHAIIKNLTASETYGTAKIWNETTNSFDAIPEVSADDTRKIVITKAGNYISVDKTGDIYYNGQKVSTSDPLAVQAVQITDIGIYENSGKEQLYALNQVGQILVVDNLAGITASSFNFELYKLSNASAIYVTEMFVQNNYLIFHYQLDSGAYDWEVIGNFSPEVLKNTKPTDDAKIQSLYPYYDTSSHLLAISADSDAYLDAQKINTNMTVRFSTVAYNSVSRYYFLQTTDNEIFYGLDISTVQKVPNLISAALVMSNNGHTFILDKTPSGPAKPSGSDRLYSWGNNELKTLGLDNTVNQTSPVQATATENQSVVDIASSDTATYALMADSTVRAWGNNDYGQLGINSTTSVHDIYVKIPTLSNIARVYAHDSTGYALDLDGAIWAWGKNAQGKTTQGESLPSYTPVKYSNTGIQPIIDIKFSDDEIYLLRANNTLLRGTTISNAQDMLLYDVEDFDVLDSGEVVYINNKGEVKNQAGTTLYTKADGTSDTAKAIIARGSTNPAANQSSPRYYITTSTGQLLVMGDNTSGLLSPKLANTNILDWAQVHSVAGDVQKVVSAKDSVVAYNSDGTVFAWGNNEFGQLGAGDYSVHNDVLRLANVQKVTNVFASNNLANARIFFTGSIDEPKSKSGKVYAWGNNDLGQLGFERSPAQPLVQIPQEVPNYSGVDDDGNSVTIELNASKVVTNGSSTLALTANSMVVGWGKNDKGQLGIAPSSNYESPTVIPNLSNVVDIAIGESTGYAIRGDGTAVSFGSNEFGQMGINKENIQQALPQFIWGIVNAKSVAASSGSAYITKTDGTVWSFGRGDLGQLGLPEAEGKTTNKYKPFQIPSLYGVMSVAATQESAAALTTSGNVYLWGEGQHGLLGNGNYDDNGFTPTELSEVIQSPCSNNAVAPPKFAQVSGGENSLLLLDRNNCIWALGDNSHHQFGSLAADKLAVAQEFTTGTSIFTAGYNTTQVGRNNQIIYYGGPTPLNSPTSVDFATLGTIYSLTTGGNENNLANYIISSEQPSSANGSLSNIYIWGDTSNTQVFKTVDTAVCKNSASIGVDPCLIQISSDAMHAGVTGTKAVTTNNAYAVLTNDGRVLVSPPSSSLNYFADFAPPPAQKQADIPICNNLCNIVDIATTDNFFYALDNLGKVWQFAVNSTQISTPVSSSAISFNVTDNSGASPVQVTLIANKLSASGTNVAVYYEGDLNASSFFKSSNDSLSFISVSVSTSDQGEVVEKAWAGPNAFYVLYNDDKLFVPVIYSMGNNTDCALAQSNESNCDAQTTSTSLEPATLINEKLKSASVVDMQFTATTIVLLDDNGYAWGYGSGQNGELAQSESRQQDLPTSPVAYPVLSFGQMQTANHIAAGGHAFFGWNTTDDDTTSYTWGSPASGISGANCAILAHGSTDCASITDSVNNYTQLFPSITQKAVGFTGKLGISSADISNNDFGVFTGSTAKLPVFEETQSVWSYQVGTKFTLNPQIAAIPALNQVPVVQVTSPSGKTLGDYGLEMVCDISSGIYSNCQIEPFSNVQPGQYFETGAFSVRITANNIVGSAQADYEIDVSGSIPTMNSIADYSFNVGDTVNIPLKFTGSPAVLAEEIEITPEIEGLDIKTLDTNSFAISGTAKAPISTTLQVSAHTLLGGVQSSFAYNVNLEPIMHIPCNNNQAIADDGRNCVFSLGSSDIVHFDLGVFGGISTDDVQIVPAPAIDLDFTKTRANGQLAELGISIDKSILNPDDSQKYYLSSGGSNLGALAGSAKYGRYPFIATFGTFTQNFWIDYADQAPSILGGTGFTASVGSTLSANFTVQGVPAAAVGIDLSDGTCMAPSWMYLLTLSNTNADGSVSSAFNYAIVANALPKEYLGSYKVKIVAYQEISANESTTTSKCFDINITGSSPVLSLPLGEHSVDINNPSAKLEIPLIATGDPIPQLQIIQTDADFLELDDGPTSQGVVNNGIRTWYLFANSNALTKDDIGSYTAVVKATNMLGESQNLTVPFEVYESARINPDLSKTTQSVNSVLDIGLNVTGNPAPVVNISPQWATPAWATNANLQLVKDGDEYFLRTLSAITTQLVDTIPIQITQDHYTLNYNLPIEITTDEEPKVHIDSTLYYTSGVEFSQKFSQTGNPCSENLTLAEDAPSWLSIEHEGTDNCNNWYLTGIVPAVEFPTNYTYSIQETRQSFAINVEMFNIQVHIPTTIALTTLKAVDILIPTTGKQPSQISFLPSGLSVPPPGLEIVYNNGSYHLVGVPTSAGNYSTQIFASTDDPNINQTIAVNFIVAQNQAPAKLHINGPSTVKQGQYARWDLNMTGTCATVHLVAKTQEIMDVLGLQLQGSCLQHNLNISGVIKLDAEQDQYILDFGYLGKLSLFVYNSGIAPTWTALKSYTFSQYSFAQIELGLQDLGCGKSNDITYDQTSFTMPPGMYIKGGCTDPFGYRIEGIPTTAGTYNLELEVFVNGIKISHHLTIAILALTEKPEIVRQTTIPVVPQGSFLTMRIPTLGIPMPEVDILAVSHNKLPAGIDIVQNSSGSYYLSGSIADNTPLGTYTTSLIARNTVGTSDVVTYAFTVVENSSAPKFYADTHEYSVPANDSFLVDLPISWRPIGTVTTTGCINSGSANLDNLQISALQNSVQLSGVATSIGRCSLEVTAQNANGQATVQITITVVPSSTSFNFSSEQFATIGSNLQLNLGVIGVPMPDEVTVQGLPDGLGVQKIGTQFYLTGIPSFIGNYSLNFSALRSGTVLITATMLLHIKSTKYEFHVSNSAFTTVGNVFAMPLNLTGTPCIEPADISITGQPNWLQLQGSCKNGTSNYELRGVADQEGVHHINLSAGNANAEIILEVADSALGLKLEDDAISVTIGESFHSKIWATGSPMPVITTSSLPAGVNFDSSSLYGSPLNIGIYTIRITATQDEHAISSDFLLTVNPLAPKIGVDANLTFTVNSAVNQSLKISGNPCLRPRVISGILPTGLALQGNNCNDDSYSIVGLPTSVGISNVTFQLADDISTARTITIQIAGSSPVIGLGDIYTSKERYFSKDLNLAGNPSPDAQIVSISPKLDQDELIEISNQKISGIVKHVQNYAISLSATSSSGSSNKTVILHSQGIAPSFSVDTNQTTTFGRFARIDLGVFGDPMPDISFTGDLPTGMRLSAGYIEGTPNALGDFPITLKAQNAQEESTYLAMSIKVVEQNINFNIETEQIFTAEKFSKVNLGLPNLPSISLTAQTSKNGQTLQTPLPSGLELYRDIDNVWYLQGAPTESSTYFVTLTAINGTNMDTRVDLPISLTVLPSLPLITFTGETSYTTNSAVRIDITVHGDPTPALRALNNELPSGLYLYGSGSNYQILGSLAYSGTYEIVLVAENTASIKTTKHIRVQVVDSEPTFNCESNYSIAVGQTVDIDLGVFGTGIVDVEANNLPVGLSLEHQNEKWIIAGTAYLSQDIATQFTIRRELGDPVQKIVHFYVIDSELTANIAHNYDVSVDRYFAINLNVVSHTPATVQVLNTLPEGIYLTGNFGIEPFRIIGELHEIGVYTIDLELQNAGQTLDISFTITVNPKLPSFPSLPDELHFTASRFVHYSIDTTGNPAPSLTIYSGSLPLGMQLVDSAIIGIPQVEMIASSPYTVTFQLESAGNIERKTVLIYVQDASAKINISSSYIEMNLQTLAYIPLHVTGDPAPKLEVSGLPDGIRCTGNALLGYHLVGKPDRPGIYEVQLIAVNANGADSKTLVLNVAGNEPIFAGDRNFKVVVNSDTSLNLHLIANPLTSLTVVDGQLPPGLVIDQETASITGRSDALGVYNFKIKATQNETYATENFQIEVVQNSLNILSDSQIYLTSGKFADLDLQVTGSPTPSVQITAGIKPPGLEIVRDEVGVKITGTPTTLGVYAFTLEASLGAETISKQFTITVTPTLAKTHLDENYSIDSGKFFEVDLKATGSPLGQVKVVQGNLPEGLELKLVTDEYQIHTGVSQMTTSVNQMHTNNTRGEQKWVLSGVPIDKLGEYNFKIEISNAPNSFAYQDVALQVNGSAPKITAIESAQVIQYFYQEIPLEISGVPAAQVTVSGLPDGLKLTEVEGVHKLSGRVKATPRNYDVEVVAANSLGSDAKTIQVQVLQPEIAPDVPEEYVDNSASSISPTGVNSTIFLIIVLAFSASGILTKRKVDKYQRRRHNART